MQQLKVNKSNIKNRLEKELQYESVNFDLCATCCLYLGNDKEKTKEYYNLSIKDNAQTIIKLKDQGNMLIYLKRKLNTANYLRILNNKTEMKIILEEIEPVYHSLFTGEIKENPWHRYADFYFEWATVNFHLGNYSEAYEIGKLCYKDYMPIPPRDFAKGMLLGDNSIIEEEIDAIVAFIKRDRWKPYSSPLDVIEPWEWYEIGMQLLGLPSVLDMFKEVSNE